VLTKEEEESREAKRQQMRSRGRPKKGSTPDGVEQGEDGSSGGLFARKQFKKMVRPAKRLRDEDLYEPPVGTKRNLDGIFFFFHFFHF
jgi:hypothetical protein